MVCGVCGGSGTVLRYPLGPMRDWFRPCTGLCQGRGVVSTAQALANPRPNQIDWYGAYFGRASIYFTAEVPSIPGVWSRSLSRCAIQDLRDEYEFFIDALDSDR